MTWTTHLSPEEEYISIPETQGVCGAGRHRQAPRWSGGGAGDISERVDPARHAG